MPSRFALRPASLAVLLALGASAHANEATLPTVKVDATATRTEQTATSPVKGYVAKKSATAGRIVADQVEIAQSLSIVGQEEMKNHSLQTLSEALRVLPGSMSEKYGKDDAGAEYFTLRGMDDVTPYLDGFLNLGHSINVPFGKERLEVLRGPAGAVYGAGDLAGLINLVSKRPQKDAINSFGLGVGNHQQRELTADVGGQLDATDAVLFRLLARTAQDGVHADYPGVDKPVGRDHYFAPSLHWQLGSATRLTVMGEFLKQKKNAWHQEYIGENNVRSHILVGDPQFSNNKVNSQRLAYELEHALGNGWQFRQKLNFSEVKSSYRSLWGDPYQTADADGNVARGIYAFTSKNMNRQLISDINGTFLAGSMQHQWVAGLDLHRYDDDRIDHGFDANIPALNINHPQYGQITGHLTDAGRTKTEMRSKGLFLQDRMSLGALRVDGALRFDQVDKQSRDVPTGVETNQRDKANTARLGISYLFAGGVTPYFNLANSFRPQAGQDKAGKSFVPERGEQAELGLKYQPDDQTLFTAALYDMKKNNVTTTDPHDANFQVQTGKVGARGLELEARTQFKNGLSLTAAYSHNRTRVLSSNEGYEGKQLAAAPRHTGSVNVEYTIREGDFKGLGLGAGVRYKGASYGNSENTIVNPATTLFDASLWYKQGAWTTRLRVNNALNKDYLSSVMHGAVAEKRVIRLNTEYRF